MEIVPLQQLWDLDDVKKHNLTDLRTGAQQLDSLPRDTALSDIFTAQPDYSDRIHFLVWLPPEDLPDLTALERFPPPPHHALAWLMTITMTNILNFENITSVSQSLYGGRRHFKHLVLREYGQFDQNNRFDMATGETFPDVAVTHIFLYRWQKFLPQFTSLNEIDDPVAWAFNRAKLCIQVDSAGRMFFHLFDEELRDVCLASKARSLQAVAAQDDEVLGIGGTELNATFGDLHGQALQFP
ncbi:hypothetical protein L208DRAFT_1383234, partial [Tricholoma matsutake]